MFRYKKKTNNNKKNHAEQEEPAKAAGSEASGNAYTEDTDAEGSGSNAKGCRKVMAETSCKASI